MATDNNLPIEIFKSKDGKISIDVKVDNESVWLTANQLSALFDRDKSVISRHLKNIFETGELIRNSVVAKNATTGSDGKTYHVDHYNLDMIISIGYRVNSIVGTQFRIWSSKVLKKYLLDGYVLNKQKLLTSGFEHLEQVTNLLTSSLSSINNNSEDIISLINSYSRSWKLLLQYDQQNIDNIKPIYDKFLNFDLVIAQQAIEQLKISVCKLPDAKNVFGKDNNNNLKSIIKNIEQTFDGKPLYPTIEERASYLLYFVIKNHPFTDGNKRIASLLFILYLKHHQYNYHKINDSMLVALTLMIASSKPQEKDTVVKLIMHLLH